MKLTDAHSSRVQSVIDRALRREVSEIKSCPHCDEYFCTDHGHYIVFSRIDVGILTMAVLHGLIELETELEAKNGNGTTIGAPENGATDRIS